MRTNLASIEQLESRTFLSGTTSLLPDVVPTTHATTRAANAVKTVVGPTLNAIAGAPFSGKLGFYQSGILDPPGKYSATVSWGDGTATTNATIAYGMSGTEYGYIISGAHTFKKAGTYTVKVTLIIGPYSPSITFPTSIVEYIDDKAIVAARHANSAGGVTIHPPLDKKFSAEIGTFSFPAPAIGLTAIVNWGDGTSSTGVVKSIGVQGIDVIDFAVYGTHTYLLPGTYGITIAVKKPGLTATSPKFSVATIDSTAIVAGPTAVTA